MGPSSERPVPRLLVVEHVQSTRGLMGLVLEKHYQTQTAATYEQALRGLRTTPFDGIVLSVDRREEGDGERVTTFARRDTRAARRGDHVRM